MASFEKIILDTGHTDEQAVLVMRDGRLTAVLSHLSAMHGELAGMWFVEVTFGILQPTSRHTFSSPDDFAAWLEEETSRKSISRSL